MKKFLSTLLIAFAIFAGNAQTGNFGIGTNTPGTKLDVNGAITNRETSFAVSSNAVTITANVSQAKLTGAATAEIAVTGPTAPNAGQRLVIYNNTTGGFGATLNGFSTPAGMAMEYAYSNGGWQALKSIPQMAVIEMATGTTVTRAASGSATPVPNAALKVNTITGAVYQGIDAQHPTAYITLPAGTYQVTMNYEGDGAPITSTSAAGSTPGTGDGLKPNHSFYYDFQNSPAFKRVHGNTITNFGTNSNFGVAVQYTVTITSAKNFPFEIGWGQGGNVKTGQIYDISTGTQLSILRIF